MKKKALWFLLPFALSLPLLVAILYISINYGQWFGDFISAGVKVAIMP